MTEICAPKYQDILWPTLKALIENGGSASNEELNSSVSQIMDLSDEVLDLPHGKGAISKVEYNAAWARSHLKIIDAVVNSERGVWAISDIGRAIKNEEEVRQSVKHARRERYLESRYVETDETDGNSEPDDIGWEEELLTHLRGIEPAAFERLCQRILRESGFVRVEVKGRSGDGGIDGTGVLRVNLLSFQVLFQSKRYTGSVGSSEIRDFRGAMVGRADKGLFITTGRFTKEAEREAVRDGAPAIDLIDGKDICILLKDLKLGVTTENIEKVTVEREFFSSI